MNRPAGDEIRRVDRLRYMRIDSRIMKITVVLMLLVLAIPCRAATLLAEDGKTRHVILVDPAATAPERNAANELCLTLQQITGADFSVRTNTEAPDRVVLVGPGEAARRSFAEVPFD